MAMFTLGAKLCSAGAVAVAAMIAPSLTMAGDQRAQPYPHGETSLARELNGREPGQPVNCIAGRKVSDVWVVEQTAILYRMRDGTVYVSRPVAGADGLARDSVRGMIGDRTLCQGYGVGMFSAGGKGVRGSTAVRLGAFTPYTRP